MKMYAERHKDTFSKVAQGKRLSRRLSIQISTTLFLKYFLVICHAQTFSPSLSLTSFSPCTLFTYIHTGMHSYRPRQSGNGYICRLHGSHSARPMERERHFNLPAYYFMTFLIWRASSWYFPKVEASRPLYLRRPRSWRINIEQLSSPTG